MDEEIERLIVSVRADTGAFLDRRIEDVMRFEKLKAEWRGSSDHLSVARFLGRLRYPPR